jgi:hypothetical protein
MGDPGKMGYSGGQLSPMEKDLISGRVAAKSLHIILAMRILEFS